jgi:arabinogalactan oligomer/maltooligosaccharide transport system permease protein
MAGGTGMRARANVKSLVVHTLLAVGVVYALYPVLWVLTVAFSRDGLGTDGFVLPWPKDPSLLNFAIATGVSTGKGALFFRQVVNSLAIASATALMSIAVAAPAAYALARLPFVGKRTGLRALMLTQMFPTVASAVPLYFVLAQLHLLDRRAGLVIAYSASALPFAIFQLKAAFEAIPVDLEEAAMVDGATRFGAFVRVVLPAARPALAVTALFAFMSAWNEFVLAATLMSREEAFTLPVVLQRFVGEHAAAWGPFAAGSIVVSIPVMAIFYIAQKQLLSGLTAGSVKG